MTDGIPQHLGARIAALAEEMARHGNHREAPVREVMAKLGDRWSTLILIVLEMGEWRHADLKRVLVQLSAEKAISQRVLTLKLRALERDGFVERRATADVPPRVSYRLTALGERLAAEARRMIGWVNSQAGAIEAARQAFDMRED
ncbi:MAG TPA: helix-turn-helix domain-containing protein [Novosphingobium sp.]|nr:helix-turn-helix domain-containing protein [Novosphingobium sp.]